MKPSLAACLALLLLLFVSQLVAESVPTTEQAASEEDGLARPSERTLCRPDSWKNCVGRRWPCLCYERECRGRETIEKKVVREYNNMIVTRTYQTANLLFADNFVVDVPAFGVHLEGKTVNVAYLQLGDPDVSDQYLILNSTFLTLVQEDDSVIASLLQYYQAVQTGDIFPINLMHDFRFNDKHEMLHQLIVTDSLAFVRNLMGVLDLDIPSLCGKIQTRCSGSLQQYPDISSCESFLSSIPISLPSGLVGSGNSVTCRSFHEVLARSAPQIHCPHVGPLNLGPLLTPCT